MEQPAEIPTELTVGEENVLRYACGYVAKKLYQNFFEAAWGEVYATFVECLNRMKPNNEDSMHASSDIFYGLLTEVDYMK